MTLYFPQPKQKVFPGTTIGLQSSDRLIPKAYYRSLYLRQCLAIRFADLVSAQQYLLLVDLLLVFYEEYFFNSQHTFPFVYTNYLPNNRINRSQTNAKGIVANHLRYSKTTSLMPSLYFTTAFAFFLVNNDETG
jgi:hypothetical protein